MQFTEKEMLCRYNALDIPKDVYNNLMELRERLNKLGQYFLPSRIFTCTYRDKVHNTRVGGAKNSSHLTGEACDILDRDCELGQFLLANEPLLKKLGLYVEDYNSTHKGVSGWCHIQTRPTKSGKTFFIP